jgi:hypothetical protein
MVLFLKRTIFEAFMVVFVGVIGTWLSGLIRGKELRTKIKKEENTKIFTDFFKATIRNEEFPTKEPTVSRLEKLDSNGFFSKLPLKVYHAFDGKIKAYTERKLSFSCGCGNEHSVLDSVALVDAGLENTGIYVCPENRFIFNIIKPTGIFRITGLKNLGYLWVQDENEWHSVMLELEGRKRR